MSVFYSSVRFLLCWSLFSATETICFCPDSFILLSEWFDLLLPLPLCLSAGTLVVNVAQTFYQAEENHHITLEWTFTPKTLSSSNIYIFCQLITDQKVSVLFQLHEGVEVSESQDEQFSGRVQFDKDVLREGRLRLDVSRLRTEDSGLYLCEVNTESGSSSDKCRLNVTVRKDQDNRTNTTIIEPEKPGAEKMDVGAIVGGVLGALIGLGLILIGVLVKLGIIRMKKKQEAEKTPNISEMEKLETTSTEGDEELQKTLQETSCNMCSW
ncbi:uncharacterized protein LOC108874186 isoform X4 [Lates calcarifer]|uniref:Uncharacterized protein LOC108874186 isoform X3 n=1 Tax=Lates calcarifer TaxID=8187 RepID=A0AAJ7LAA2_LATCA|nr:uncharacterized protein LOC108874186 isoform X3 [Lates calcarifer]XP_018518159.1 uncharacterized protein LOC108874186 isoform X4 [Lates calcarifer]